MTAYTTHTDARHQEPQDTLKLEIEEIADLEIPAWKADDVLGASGSRAVADRGEVGRQNC